jgi:hypothetical protein
MKSDILRRVSVYVVSVFSFVGIGKTQVQVSYRTMAQVDYKSVAWIGIGFQQYIS